LRFTACSEQPFRLTTLNISCTVDEAERERWWGCAACRVESLALSDYQGTIPIRRTASNCPSLSPSLSKKRVLVDRPTGRQRVHSHANRLKCPPSLMQALTPELNPVKPIREFSLAAQRSSSARCIAVWT
jgi:hypothetical protein